MRSANFLSKFQRSISLNFLEALYETLQSIIFILYCYKCPQMSAKADREKSDLAVFTYER